MNKLGFKMKVLPMLGTALVALLFMAITTLLQERSLIIESRREQLATAVQSAHSIVAAFQAKAASGAMSQEDAQKAAKDALRVSRYGGPDGKTEYFYIWTLDSKGVMHPIKPEWEGQDMAGKVKDGEGTDILKTISDALKASKDGRVFVPTMFARPGQQALVPKLQYVIRVDGWNWMVGSGLYTDDIDALVRKTLLADLVLVLVVMAVVGGVGFTVARSVLRQIGGEPSEAIGIMSQVAQGNLDTQIPNAYPGSMLDGLAHMVTSLRRLVTEVRSATDSIATASTEIAQGNNDLARRTEDTASNLQTTASSMEELTSTVKQTSDSAQTANQMATSAAEVAARGGQVVAQVVSTMQDINASSNKISDIIGVIDGIAFQTNILALNAAVEAARAGEQGRGFAVVAGEVRSLAQRSAEAAKEIKQLITTSVDNVQSGSAQVEQAGQSMQDIVHSVRRVSDLIGEITASSTEQRDGIGQVNQAVATLDQMTQQNAALVEESSAAAAALHEQAQRLAQVVAVFNVGNGAVAAPRSQARVAPPAVAPAPVKTPAATPARATLAKPTPTKAAAKVSAPQIAPAKTPAASDADGEWESF